jgi:hypothetical protein
MTVSRSCRDAGRLIPEDLLAYPAQCEAMLDYCVSLMIGADDEERLAIERTSVSMAKRDQKIKWLTQEFTARRPDIAREEPYLDLPRKLRKLFRYRDIIAHSYPDHGNRYRRFRRRRGRNEIVIVTHEKIAEEWQRGIECHSALHFITVYLSGLDEELRQQARERESAEEG